MHATSSRSGHKLKLWVILGSTHRLTGRHKPHDSVYIINHRGVIVDRYDKMFCSGDRKRRTGDLAHYSPGNHFTVFTLGGGIRCGVLICYDYAFPELYREYKRRGVQLMFHSYHAGHASPKRVKTMQGEVGTRFCRLNRGSSFSEIRMRSTMQASAGSNHIWISSNTSARESCFPSFFLRPDGIITGLLRRNTAGTLTSAVNTNERVSGRELLWKEIPAAPPPRPTPPAAKPLHRVKYTPSPDHPWRSCNWRGPSRSAARPRISRSIGVPSGSGPPPAQERRLRLRRASLRPESERLKLDTKEPNSTA